MKMEQFDLIDVVYTKIGVYKIYLQKCEKYNFFKICLSCYCNHIKGEWVCKQLSGENKENIDPMQVDIF